MRKSTLLWLALAAFCSASLFYTSQHVHDGREKISALSKDVAKEAESLRVLQAEWSYLNQPKRLERLAQQHLKLQPLKGAQFIQPDSLPQPPPAGEAAEAQKPEAQEVKPEIAVKINPPAPKAVNLRAAHPGRARSFAAAAPVRQRGFGDVIKSLGVD